MFTSWTIEGQLKMAIREPLFSVIVGARFHRWENCLLAASITKSGQRRVSAAPFPPSPCTFPARACVHVCMCACVILLRPLPGVVNI